MLRAIFTLKRYSSIFANQTLVNLGTKLKLQAPKIDTTAPAKNKKKIKLLDSEYVPPDNNEAAAHFRSIKNIDIKLPEALLPVEKEWNTARQYLDSRNETLNKYATKMLDPGPRGLHWEEVEDHPGQMSSDEIRAWIRQHRTQMATEKGQQEEEDEEEEEDEGADKISEEVSGDTFAKEYFNILKDYDVKTDLLRYPGSILGPEMKDDPAYWAEWYVKNQPRPLRYFEQFGMIGGIQPESEDGKNINFAYQDIIESFMTTHYKPYEFAITHPEEEWSLQPNSPDTLCATSVLEDGEYLPAPKDLPLNMQEMTRALERWAVYPAMETSLKISKRIERGEKLPTTGKPWTPISYSSCLNYYEMLPRYYRDHRLVISVALTLERCRPMMSRKHKEIFLNKLCNFLTPRDETKYKFLQEYFIKKETLNLDNPQVDYDPAWDSDTEEFKKSLIEEWEAMFDDSDEDGGYRNNKEGRMGPKEEVEEEEEAAPAATAAKTAAAATPAATDKKEKKKFPAKDKQNRVKKEKEKKVATSSPPPKEAEEGGAAAEEDYEGYGEQDVDGEAEDAEMEFDESYLKVPGLEGEGEEFNFDYGSDFPEDPDEEGAIPKKDRKKKKAKKAKEEAAAEKEPAAPRKKKKFADEESDVSASSGDERDNDFNSMFKDKYEDVSHLTSIERENLVDWGFEKQVVKDPYPYIPLPKRQKEIEKKQAMSKEERQLMSMLGETVQERKMKMVSYPFEIPDYGVNWFERNHENIDGIIPSPITYYDNNDGYWDEWIKEKHERIGLPHMTRRCFLKH